MRSLNKAAVIYKPVDLHDWEVRIALAKDQFFINREVKRPERIPCIFNECKHLNKKECEAAIKSVGPYVVNQRLWVRESWRLLPATVQHRGVTTNVVDYRADSRVDSNTSWRLSTKMKRVDSRLLFQIVDVTVNNTTHEGKHYFRIELLKIRTGADYGRV